MFFTGNDSSLIIAELGKRNKYVPNKRKETFESRNKPQNSDCIKTKEMWHWSRPHHRGKRAKLMNKTWFSVD